MGCGTCKTCVRRKQIAARVEQLSIVADLAARGADLEMLELIKHEMRCLRLEWYALTEQVNEEIEDQILGHMLQEAVENGFAAEA